MLTQPAATVLNQKNMRLTESSPAKNDQKTLFWTIIMVSKPSNNETISGLGFVQMRFGGFKDKSLSDKPLFPKIDDVHLWRILSLLAYVAHNVVRLC